MSHLVPEDFVVVGRVSRPFGLKGWSRVTSYTEPPENILSYRPWALGRESKPESAVEWTEEVDVQTKSQSGGFFARIGACKSRTEAGGITGRLIGVPKSSLPNPEDDEFYWFELVGTKVVNLGGHVFGCVDEVFDSGAHSVLKIETNERDVMIPLVAAVVREVRPGEQVLVDWEPDW